MTNTINTTKKESNLDNFFKGDNPKTLMIINAITAFLWAFCTAIDIYSVINYDKNIGFSTYLTGGLALFYLGMTLANACKYAKLKKLAK